MVGLQDGSAGIVGSATVRGERVWLRKKIRPLKNSCKFEAIEKTNDKLWPSWLEQLLVLAVVAVMK